MLENNTKDTFVCADRIVHIAKTGSILSQVKTYFIARDGITTGNNF